MTFTCTHRVPPKKSSLSFVGFSIIDITNVCSHAQQMTITFVVPFLSFPHLFFLPFFLLLLRATPCFQCVPYHGGARIFYLYEKSDRKEVYHAAAKHRETEMIEWETECNQFFFTLRLLFSLKERTCALSLHCICACMLFFLFLFLLLPNNKTKKEHFRTHAFLFTANGFQSQTHTHNHRYIHTPMNWQNGNWVLSTRMCVCFFSLSSTLFWPAFSNTLLGLLFILYTSRLAFGFDLCIRCACVYVLFLFFFIMRESNALWIYFNAHYSFMGINCCIENTQRLFIFSFATTYISKERVIWFSFICVPFVYFFASIVVMEKT